MTQVRRVVVTGGGIAGLVAAYRLARPQGNGLPLEVTLLEASQRLGGKMSSVRLGEFDLEAGADSFVVRKPQAVDLCRELGLGEELVVPASTATFVRVGDRLVPFPRRSSFGVPAGAGELLRWPGLSIRGRVRALGDLLRPLSPDRGDESLAALLERRLGSEAARILVGPLLAGIHAGEPARLSVQATFPELAVWEREHGSLLRGAVAARKKADAERAAPLFAAVWGGFSRLVDALAAAIGSPRIRVGERVRRVGREAPSFSVDFATGRLAADAVILATPAFETSRLLLEANAEASRELSEIRYASTAVVLLVYPEGTAERLPQGTGYVVPTGSSLTTACTWVSRKWPRVEFGDRAVIRCYVGRSGAEEALALSDSEIVARVRAELDLVVSLGPPEDSTVVRWERSMPQYDVGHMDRLRRIEAAIARTPGLFVTGSSYRGVGIADCIREGSSAAVRVRRYLLDARGGHASVPGAGTPAEERERMR